VLAATNSQERRWWRLTLAYLVLLYLSLWPLQFLLDFLRDHNLLRISILSLGGLAAAVAVAALVRRRAGPREWLALFGAACAYGLIAARMEIIQERLHLAEYGVLALLFRASLAARGRGRNGRRSRPAVAGAALGLTAVAGLVDELIQGVLPNRQYDLRDVGFNALAAALALAAVAALELARRADRRRRTEDEWTPA